MIKRTALDTFKINSDGFVYPDGGFKKIATRSEAIELLVELIEALNLRAEAATSKKRPAQCMFNAMLND